MLINRIARVKAITSGFSVVPPVLLLVACIQLASAVEAVASNTTAVIQGVSMQPSLTGGDVVQLVPAVANTVFSHGQIIAVNFTGRDRRMLKRLFALPGDKLVLENGKLLINNTLVVPTGWPEVLRIPEKAGLVLKKQLLRYNNILPANRFVVLGDNPFNSLDSLDYGFVERTQITGVVDDRY